MEGFSHRWSLPQEYVLQRLAILEVLGRRKFASVNQAGAGQELYNLTKFGHMLIHRKWTNFGGGELRLFCTPRELLRFPSQPECDDREYVLRPLPCLSPLRFHMERTNNAPAPR